MSRSPLGLRLLLSAAATFTAAVTDAAPAPIAVKRLDGTQVTEAVLTARTVVTASASVSRGRFVEGI